jgi:beta-N-acetylhexosaminidase
MARELSALGINLNFAPVADVNNNPFNPVIGVRAFGSSPELVSRLSGAMASAFAKEGVIPSAKHFPGHGNTETDSHSGLPLISSTREELEKTEFPALPHPCGVRSAHGHDCPCACTGSRP